MTDPVVVQLHRFANNDQGVLGRLSAPGFTCWTLELPWRDNRTGRSCIPADKEYLLDWIKPRRAFSGFTELYWVHDVTNRFGILIHPATFAGDVDLGYRSHLLGCIALGLNYGTHNGQRAIFNSRTAVRQFHEAMGKRRGRLIITEGNENARAA